MSEIKEISITEIAPVAVAKVSVMMDEINRFANWRNDPKQAAILLDNLVYLLENESAQEIKDFFKKL